MDDLPRHRSLGLRRPLVAVVERLVIGVFAAVMAFNSASAAEPVGLAVAGFDFVDTSGEVRDQGADHARRLAALNKTVATSLSGDNRVTVVSLECFGTCSAATDGLEFLSEQAVKAGATHLLIGQVRKMSTLIGGVKFAIIDLSTNRATCDRFLSYRGDTDEAWGRAAIYTAMDVVKHCLP